MQNNELNDVLEKVDVNYRALHMIVTDVNCWDDSLEDLVYYRNDETFFEIFYSGRENGYSEVARAVCYGNYDYADPYVKINAHGNLTSISDIELEYDLEKSKAEILENFLDAVADGADLYTGYQPIIDFDNLDKDSQKVLTIHYPDLFDYDFDDDEE